MKKILIIIVIIAVLVPMCVGIGYGIGVYTKPKESAITTTTITEPTPEPENKMPYWFPENLEELEANTPQPVTEREYINRECGYKITFPESWLGWFLIDDSNPEAVDIRFYGESIFGRFGGRSSTCDYGILMFTIVTESEIYENPDWGTTYDGTYLIGYANGERIYDGATARNQGLFEDASNTDYYDESERERAKKDHLKFNEMGRDRAAYGFLYTTFEEIK